MMMIGDIKTFQESRRGLRDTQPMVSQSDKQTDYI